MAEKNETRVFYKALADFSNVYKEHKKLRSEIAKTQAAEKAYNDGAAKQRAASTKASQARAKALAQESRSLKLVLAQLTTYKRRQEAITVATRAATTQIQRQNRALLTNAKRLSEAAQSAKEYADSQRKIARATGTSSDAIRAQKELNRSQAETTDSTRKQTEALRESAAATDDLADHSVKLHDGLGLVDQQTGEVIMSMDDYTASLDKNTTAVDTSRRANVRFGNDSGKLPPILRRIKDGGDDLYKGLRRFGNWRPRLTPPFVALIPIIGAVIAAINPLLALLGAVGTAAFALASNIASLSGAFLALPGILSGVVAGIAGVVASMGGVGNVFKTYSAMQKALGKNAGSGGETQAERADRLADAEYNLARAQKNVTKAQDRLNKARQEALRDLIDLRQEVSRASLNEERAIANLQQARDAYNNVMADPASQAGDKLDATVAIKEAEADLADVRQQNIDNQNALIEAERRGVNQSEKVLDAEEALEDAMRSQRDVQRTMRQEAAGGSAAATAVDEYNKALAELSPSARTVVLALIAMQDQWKAMRNDLQENFFSEIVDDMDLLPRIIQNIGNFLRPATRAMGQFTSSFLQMFASPEWTRDLKTIGEQNGTVVKNLGDGVLALSTFMKDLVLAAGPFTEFMTNGFAEGSENFSKLLDTEEERNGLAGWLSLVEERMRRWWAIIKNIGTTLFNYGVAASGFGDWLSEGFLEMTQNWVTASENAKEGGSNFRTYLENIKPLLEEVDRLFGNLFGWLSKEFMDPQNIEDATDLVTIFNDDLGPAIGGFLDALAETDIDESFFKALSSIIESLTIVMENGGGTALETFFNVVAGFFQTLADIAKAIPKPVLEGILTFLGTLAAITFVGKFTGITAALGFLLRLDKAKFTSIIGKGGLFALVTAGLVANFQSLSDSWASIADSQAKLEEGDPEGAIKSLTDDGTLAKGLLGGAGLGVGPLTDFIGWFSPETKATIDNWFEDVSIGISEFVIGMINEFNKLKTNLTIVVAGIDLNVIQPLRNIFNNLPFFFSTLVGQLGAAWAGIAQQFRDPINWVIRNVYNGGIVPFWNNTAGKLGLGQLSPAAEIAAQNNNTGKGSNWSRYAEGGVLPGYTPGRDVHEFYSPTAGGLKLSGGEAIMRPEFTRAVGGEKGVEELNKKARRGQAFRDGGIMRLFKNPTPAKKQTSSGPIQNLMNFTDDVLKNVSGVVSRVFSDPVGFVRDGLSKIVGPLLGGVGNGPWADVARAIPGKLVEALAGSAKGVFASPTGEGGGGPALARVKSMLPPGLRITSTYRTPAQNRAVGGHPASKHMDRANPAVDIAGPVGAMNQFALTLARAGGWRELLYNNISAPGIRWSPGHHDHIHAAKNGGVFDDGGVLKPGHAGFNFSGKPEAVLTDEESRGLKALLSATGLSARPSSLGASPATAVSSMPRVVDNSINIRELTVVNPRAEKPSESLPKTIRNLGYMNQARASNTR